MFIRVGCFGFWHINHCWSFNAKYSIYIYIRYIWFGLVEVFGISTIVDYLLPNTLYTNILNIYDMVWLSFMAYQSFAVYSMPNPLYTYISDIQNLVWLIFMAYQPCRLFNPESFLYIYWIYVIWFGWVL